MLHYVYQTIRALFFSLDKIIYGLISDVYELLLLISRTTIFSGEVIAEFASRIYALAGIFMLFKVSLSIIHYVINPDDFTEKEKGFSSIWKRIIFSLVMLVMTPYIFHEAYNLQRIILEENTIMNLIFGSPGSNALPNSDYADNAGRHIQFTLMYSFMRPNTGEFTELTETCAETYMTDGNGNLVYRELSSGRTSRFIYELNPQCFGTYQNGKYQNDGALSRLFNDLRDEIPESFYQDYAQGIANQEFKDLTRHSDLILIKEKQGNNTNGAARYLIDYKFFVSTAVGAAVVYLLGLFCIEIAIRSVKLGFLQMISPIPILSYIDPKSGKDGLFKKWYQMCISTYLSLFMRLFALFMGVYAISVIGGYTDVITNEEIKGNWLLNVFMIIGILLFAEKLPKLIEELFPGAFKGSGKFSLNPLKDLPGGKALKKGAVGLGAGLGAGLAAGGANLIAPGQKGFLKRPLSALAGMASGFGRGVASGAKGDKLGKSFSNSYSGAMKAKQSRADRIDDGVDFWEMQKAKFQQTTGGHTKGEAVKSANEAAKKIQDTYKAMQNAAGGNDKAPFNATAFGGDAKYGSFAGIKGLDKYLEEVKKTSINRNDYGTGPTGESAYLAAIADQQKTISDLEDIKDTRLNKLAAGTASTGNPDTDKAIQEGYAVMQAAVSDVNKATRAFDPDIGELNATLDAKTINGTSKGVSSRIAGSVEANKATTVDRYASKPKQS